MFGRRTKSGESHVGTNGLQRQDAFDAKVCCDASIHVHIKEVVRASDGQVARNFAECDVELLETGTTGPVPKAGAWWRKYFDSGALIAALAPTVA